MRNQTSSNSISNKGLQVGSNIVHLFSEVFFNFSSVSVHGDDTFGEVANIDEINRGDVLAHGRLDGGEDLFGENGVHGDFFKTVTDIVSEAVFGLDNVGNLGIQNVVLDDLGKFRVMVGVPLSHTHREGVDVFVQLVKKGNGLGDHVVSAVNVELDLTTRVTVTKTQLSLFEVPILQNFDSFMEVEANRSQDLENSLVLDAVDARAGILDSTTQLLLRNTQLILGLLFGFGVVVFQEGLQGVVNKTLRNAVDVPKSVSGRQERHESLLRNEGGEFSKVG
mmetsp:Transcript_31742/g.49650  ORF Transcript_31742/g.49650 Transcript_31742/m.49650 type:complete len:279 (+) Transcript_31742:516-1352(+)